MFLATSDEIKLIDKTAADRLGISEYELIGRAGEAIAKAVRERVPKGTLVVVLAGKGNNGADGYSAAKHLMSEYDTVVYDVFCTGQKGNDGKRYADEFIALGGTVKPFDNVIGLRNDIECCACVIDAIFGIGVKGELPEFLTDIAEILRDAKDTFKIAVDIPLGVSSDDATVDERFVYAADATVSLCLLKPSNVSYPAKEYMGKVIYDNINLQIDNILEKNDFKNIFVDDLNISTLIPK